ncbi:MAG: hypothetical protein ABIK38_05455 [candidate division WOR-3 bacterium]
MGALVFIIIVSNQFAQEQMPKMSTSSLCSLYYSPERVRQFAEYLFDEGDYLRAAGEFERYMIMTGKTGDPNLLYTIGRCYLLGNRLERARAYFIRISGELKQQADYEIAKSYHQEGKYRHSLEFISACNYQADSLYALKIKNLLFLRKFREAYKLVQQRPTETQLNQIVISAAHLPYRSQAAAGLLSAVFPGLGKVYAGRWADGLFSFLAVSFTGMQAYEGFRREGERSVKGWIYGTLCFGFYAGNIWGSLVAAKQYNRKIENEILNRIALLDSIRQDANQP